MRIAPIVRYCSSCHNQDVSKLHVDFDAYWDGPVIDTPDLKVAIDDLVLCEDCLRAAGVLIGCVDVPEMKRENKELGEAVEQKTQELRHLKELVKDMRRVVNSAITDNRADKNVLAKADELVGV